MRLVLDGYGAYLSMEKGCYVVKDKKGNISKYPLFENIIDEVILKSGNTITTGALTSLGWWETDVLFLTRKGRPVCYLKSIDDNSHVKTRLKQYEVYNNEKGFYIAKQISLAKVSGINMVLEKYGLTPYYEYLDYVKDVDIENYKTKLVATEGSISKRYFRQILTLIPEKIRPEMRKRYQAYEGINNVFNFAYEVLRWKVHRAIIRAKLEPFLGFLHSVMRSRPSLVCDLQEVYRCLIDLFVIEYCKELSPKDFIVKSERISNKRIGKREYLKESKTREMLKQLYDYLNTKIDIPRTKWGKKQTLDTLIREETGLLARYIRDDVREWIPRITNI